jgi:hypothetical protein
MSYPTFNFSLNHDVNDDVNNDVNHDKQYKYHDPFYGEREIEKGTFWYDPKVDTCVDTSDRGGQCTNKRMVGHLLCRYHYSEGH